LQEHSVMQLLTSFEKPSETLILYRHLQRAVSRRSAASVELYVESLVTVALPNRGAWMKDFLTIAAILIAYLVLTRWVLPKLGVPT
jgi:hypothetical protein